MFTVSVRTHFVAAAALALTAFGLGTGVVSTPITGTPAAQAQGLVEFASVSGLDPAALCFGDPIRNGNYLFTNALPTPAGHYEAGARTRGGYAVTLQSSAAFAIAPDGNYLFVADPDGNYLFTNRSDGLMMTPGGYGLTRSGAVLTPKGDLFPVGTGYTTPDGYTFGVNKDGSRALVTPDGNYLFTIRDSAGPHMNPSGVYYD